MRNFWLILCVLWLWTCSGGEKASGPQEPPIVINLTSLGGQAQKGPFNNGTAINVAELTNTLSPTGRNFSSAITDNTGRFAVANVQLESPYVELRANGYYFNEVSNEISSGQLTLFALSNLTGKTSLNVNILTHLEKNRMVTLMSGDNPKTFAQAKIQAQDEVFAIFDYSRANVPESELLDISQSGAANAKLLAISAIVQGDLAVGQMSQLLANISTDIAADGTLDDTNLRNTLIENSKNLNMAEVRSNLVAHYASLGISATIPDFESEINQFLKPPVVQDIDLSVDEDNAINITLSGSDPEGESITFSIVDDTDNATLTLNGNVVNYTPNAHFNGTDIFTYKANDGTSDSNTGTVTITVNAVEDEPNTIDVTATTDEDNAVDVSLSAEEYDGDSYSFAIISQPSNGSVSLDGTNATYTPSQDFNGEDTFTFEATDDTGRTINVATATITVNPINDAPVANDITNQFTDENRMMQLDITLDATDVEGDVLTYSVVGTNNGTVTVNGSTATYTPNQDWNGEDTFTYKANDGTDDSNTATVTVTVNSVNDAPVTQNVSFTTDEDTPYTESYTAYVSDIEGDNLTITTVTDPTNGTATCDDATNCTYTPNQDFNGTDSFTYKVNDGELDSNISTVSVTINPVNDAPTAVDVSKTMDEDGGTIEVETNYNDIDGDTDLTFTLVDAPSNGTATVGIPGTYTPNANFHGTDTFTYTVSDAEFTSDPATVTITVNSINDIPVVYDASVSGDEDATSSVGGSSINGFKFILPEATDVESGTSDDFHNSLEIVTLPTHGKIYSNNNEGDDSPENELSVGSAINNIDDGYGARIWYVQDSDNWNGTDTFTYKANDGEADSNIATVTVTVNPANDPPTAEDVDLVTRENVPVEIVFDGSDIDSGASLTYIISSQPTNGTITSGDNITYYYTPNTGYLGTDAATYVANDGETNSNTANISIQVIAGNAPSATNGVFNIQYSQGQTDYTTSLSGSTYDIDGDPLTWFIDSQPDIGSASLNGSDLTYTIDESYTGETYQTSLSWYANDNANNSNIATLTIEVDLTFGGYIDDISEYDSDAYINNFTSGLRTSDVSYLGQQNAGSTGFFIGNRAGEINAKAYARDFDRFDYWQDDYSLEINFDQPSLAWDYLHERLNGYVPFSTYMHVNATGERIQIFSGYWDSDASGTWNVWNQGNDSEPVNGYLTYEPIFCFAPIDLNTPYDPAKESNYHTDDDLASSGGLGWYSLDQATWELPDGRQVYYPFVTSLLFSNKSNPTFSLVHPTAGNHTVLNTGYTTGSAIFFNTKQSSSRNIPNQPIQIPLRPGFNYIEK